MKNYSKKLLNSGKCIFLAYDQGLEHGPESDFNDKSADPNYIINIAKEAKLNGLIFHKGIAERYLKEIKKSKVPLILKLNGKTKLYSGEPISAQIASVKDAIKFGAKAVGYTIYIGSKYESKIIEQFEKILEEAHKYNLPVIAWIYPRGKSVKNPNSRENLIYACRVALELGADFVKVHWNGKLDDLKYAIDFSKGLNVLVAGGKKKSEFEFIKSCKNALKCGVSGFAVGRNLWQSKNPVELAKKLRKLVNDSH